MFEKIDGMKMYIFFAFMIALGALKTFTEIPEIESISVVGISEASTLISTGIAGLFGRSTLKKFEA